MKYIILVLLLSACGSEDHNSRSKYISQVIDPELEVIIEEWKSDMLDAGIDISGYDDIYKIVVSDLPERKLGICTYGRTNKINIRPGLPEAVLKAVMYHELGHCALDQDHWGDLGDIMHDTIPVSNEYWLDIWDTAKYKYVTKIFEEQHNANANE